MAEHVITGIGTELKRAREAAGLPIRDVAERLKLLPRQIESLEHERFDRLPGPSIARAMVRNYARLLNLDPEPLVGRMTPPTEKPPEPMVASSRQEAMPSSSPGRRSTLLYASFSGVVLAAVGAFTYQWQHKAATREYVAPTEPQSSQPAMAQKPIAKPAEKPVAEPVEERVQEPAAIEKPPVVAAQAQPRAEPEPGGRPVPAVQPGVHRLVLRTEQEAWLEVRDGSGRSLVSSLNPAGTERAVRGQPPFDLVIGNAANVKLTYDGKPVDLAAHIKGEVARLTLN